MTVKKKKNGAHQMTIIIALTETIHHEFPNFKFCTNSVSALSFYMMQIMKSTV